jgi:hypothetical protein
VYLFSGISYIISMDYTYYFEKWRCSNSKIAGFRQSSNLRKIFIIRSNAFNKPCELLPWVRTNEWKYMFGTTKFSMGRITSPRPLWSLYTVGAPLLFSHSRYTACKLKITNNFANSTIYSNRL